MRTAIIAAAIVAAIGQASHAQKLTYAQTCKAKDEAFRRIEAIERKGDRAASRAASVWRLPTFRSPFDLLSAHAKTSAKRRELSANERRYLDERARRAKDRILYEQKERLRSQYGPTVLSADVGIDWRQRLEFDRPKIDLERLKDEIEKQRLRQKQVERLRKERIADDERRRADLFDSGKTCGRCKHRACRCEVEYVTRQPIEDAPTVIPITLPGRLTISFAENGFRDGRVYRLPPDRVPVRRRPPCACGRNDCAGRGPSCGPPPIPPEIDPFDDPIDDPPKPKRSDQLDEKSAARPSRRFVWPISSRLFTPDAASVVRRGFSWFD